MQSIATQSKLKLARLISFGLSTLWAILPWEINRILGIILAYLWFDVFRLRRKVLSENIKMVFPELNQNEIDSLARKSLQALCRSFFDVIKIPSLTSRWIDKYVVVHNQKYLSAAIENEKKGVLFLTLHLGSGDLGAAIVSKTIFPLSLISKRFQSDFLNEFWFSLRGRSSTEFIDAHSSRNAFEILAALRRRRGVTFVLDQFMGKPYGVESVFFGKNTGTAYGLALFAKKTRLPVIPLFTFWDPSGRLNIEFGQAIALDPELSETNEMMTNRFNQVLEGIIRQHPDQWMWVHRRWKKFE